jgi:uncharacterized radical SAM protein YgiQ
LHKRAPKLDREKTVIRLPAFEAVSKDSILYAHASRVMHLETNPGNARALVQRHGDRDVWLNPPPLPLATKEMDGIYELPYQRLPHPAYGEDKIPAYEMIRFSIAIQRGCFGGCTFCSITEHEGRIIQNRSEDSVIREIETIRDTVPGFTGVISDLGGPTANMYRIACKSREIESACRLPSCVYPDICQNLNTDHAPLIHLYKRARELPGIKKVLIGSGVRYDLAIQSPAYVKELVQHHVGGYLKIAPEHSREGPLSKMMKPGMGAYYKFKELFDKYSKEVGKEQYLIPYFIAAHPGTTDEDMLELALWLKQNGFRADQVQAFLPSPMATATAMYHSGKNPLGDPEQRAGVHPQGPQAAPAAQGVPALSRRQQLADAASRAAAHAPYGPYRLGQTPADSDLPAGRHRPGSRGTSRRQTLRHATHRPAALRAEEIQVVARRTATAQDAASRQSHRYRQAALIAI